MSIDNVRMTPLKWELIVRRRESATRGVPQIREDLNWVNNAVTLLLGERNCVLVDTFLSEQHTSDVIERIKASGLNLQTIYITHGHADHFFGLELLREHFPNAKAIAVSKAVEAMKQSIAVEEADGGWSKRFPGQIPTKLTVSDVFSGDTFELEGHTLHIVDIGHTDTDNTTALHIPSVGLVISGDGVYNGTHPYLGESDEGGREAWLAALDKIEALNPEFVVAGHSVSDPDSSPRHIDITRQYILNFNRLNKVTSTALELYNQMLEIYPDWINPGSLWAAAHSAKKTGS